MLAMIRGFVALTLTFIANMGLVSVLWGAVWYCTPEPLWNGVKDMLVFLHIPPTAENLILNLSLVTIFVPCLFCRTWLMQRIILFMMGARKATGKDYEKLSGALRLVCEKENRALDDYNLYVLEEAECNAAAFGKNNIIVTRGAIDKLWTLPLAGILAHEAGHIHNGDTRINILLSCMGFFGDMAVSILNLTVMVCNWFVWVPIVNIVLGIYTWAVAICLTVIHFVINAPSLLVTLLFSRYEEYDADRYACELGFAAELYKGLSFVTRSEKPVGFVDSFWSTHPVTEKRLKRIRQYMGRVEEDEKYD
jgi:STE24 endopeptidase